MARKKVKKRVKENVKKEMGFANVFFFLGLILWLGAFLYSYLFFGGARTVADIYVGWAGLILLYAGVLIYFFFVRVDLFAKGFDYLKESRRYVYFIFFLFVFGGLAGFFFPDNFTFIDETLRNLVGRVEGLNTIELTIFIFTNNSISAFSGLVIGIFLGIMPIFSSLFNGVVLGYVFNGVAQLNGYGDFWRILPHGIFELPAIFISLGLGVKLGMFIFSKRRWKEFERRFVNSLFVFVTIVLPLLIVAAIIESILIVLYR